MYHLSVCKKQTNVKVIPGHTPRAWITVCYPDDLGRLSTELAPTPGSERRPGQGLMGGPDHTGAYEIYKHGVLEQIKVRCKLAQRIGKDKNKANRSSRK